MDGLSLVGIDHVKWSPRPEQSAIQGAAQMQAFAGGLVVSVPQPEPRECIRITLDGAEFEILWFSYTPQPDARGDWLAVCELAFSQKPPHRVGSVLAVVIPFDLSHLPALAFAPRELRFTGLVTSIEPAGDGWTMRTKSFPEVPPA